MSDEPRPPGIKRAGPAKQRTFVPTPDGLSDRDRRVILLWNDGFPTREIMLRCAVNRGRIYTIVARAKEKGAGKPDRPF